MKTLIVMRHGKAELGSADTPDYNRNLNARGEDNVPATALTFVAAHKLPEAILCSAANRTMQTCDLFIKAVNYNGPVSYRQDLYLSRASYLFDTIKTLPNDIHRAMLIGHNSGVSDLVGHLISEPFVDMPTSAIAVVSLPIRSWDKLEPGTGSLSGFYYPKRQNH